MQRSSDRSQWVAQPIERRLKAMAATFIVHADVQRVLEHIEQELPIRAVLNEACGVLATGVPGSGKSRLIEELSRLYPDEETTTLTKRLCVVFKVPKSPSPRAMARALLQALGDPAYDKGNAQELTDRAFGLLATCGVRLVCIDDFQDVPARRRARGIQSIADWLRDLCSAKFPGLVIAFGTPEAAVVRDSHDQLRRRMQARFRLDEFSLSTPNRSRAFMKVLQQIDDLLPLGSGSNLAVPTVAARLFIATNGNFDYLMKLLMKALDICVRNGEESISLTHLNAGFSSQHQAAADMGNPFDESFAGNCLSGPGQIFHVIEEDPANDVMRKRARPA